MQVPHIPAPLCLPLVSDSCPSPSSPYPTVWDWVWLHHENSPVLTALTLSRQVFVAGHLDICCLMKSSHPFRDRRAGSGTSVTC